MRRYVVGNWHISHRYNEIQERFGVNLAPNGISIGVLNLSVQCNYNPDNVWIDKNSERFCVRVAQNLRSKSSSCSAKNIGHQKWQRTAFINWVVAGKSSFFVRSQKQISISFQIEWNMTVGTVFLLIFQTKWNSIKCPVFEWMGVSNCFAPAVAGLYLKLRRVYIYIYINIYICRSAYAFVDSNN